MPLIQSLGYTGLPMAEASIGRGSEGRVHTVATLTATQQVLPAQDPGPAGRAVAFGRDRGVDGVACRGTDADGRAAGDEDAVGMVPTPDPQPARAAPITMAKATARTTQQ